MKTIKAIISDLDGTLIQKSNSSANGNYHSFISEYSIKVINQLQAQGLKFTVASGRNIESIRNIRNIHKIIQDPPIVASNGAQIHTNINNETALKEYHLEPDIVEISTQLIRQYRKVTSVMTSEGVLHDNLHIPNSSLEFGYQDIKQQKNVNLINYYPNVPVYKLLVVELHQPEILPKIQKDLRNILRNRAQVIFSANDCLEVVPRKASKGNALKYIANIWNISPQEIMVFGDAPNDLSMLEIAGAPVIMENALAELQNNKNKYYQTTSNEQNGVAKFLQAWFHLQLNP